MKTWLHSIAGGLAGLVLTVQAGQSADLAEKKALTLEACKQIAAAAEKSAMSNKWNMWIVIVDDGGNYADVERMDEAQLGSLDVATQKARSAVFFKRPTKGFSDALAGGQTYILKVPNAMPIEGGIPLMADGKIVGAIGVSGGSAQQDGVVAQAGADVLGKMR
jgi:uncharacterized protein GlcG (DUF336 family)